MNSLPVPGSSTSGASAMTGVDAVIMFLLTLLLGTGTAIFIIIFLVSKLWLHGKKKGDSCTKLIPPGDMGWPLVGSIFSLFKPHPATTLGDFLQLQLSRHGKIFSTRFLGKTLVISADPEFNRFVLQNELKLFQNDLPPNFKTLLGEENLSFLAGDTYRTTKSFLLAFFSTFQLPTTFLAEVEEAADRVMTAWRNKTLILAFQEINKFVFNLAIRKAMGLTPDDPEVEDLRKAFFALNNGLHSLPFNLPFTRYSKALKARDIIWSVVKRKTEDRRLNVDRSRVDDKENNDLIGYLLKGNPSIPTQSICEGVVGLIFGASINTDITITLAMYFLRQYPKSLQHLREEFKEKVKDGGERTATLTWDDYKNMEFCQSVINETLRFGKIFPGLWRKALSDINYKGYIIPQGTKVMTHIAAMHSDPSAFENPDIFDPWRWLQTKKKNNNWMPFGGGVRFCNGMEFAKIEISVFLRHLVLNYNWEPAEPDHPVACPLVTFPKGYPINIHPLGHGEKNTC